jgi:hypothetical protein
MFGHAKAHCELGLIDNEDTFSSQFCYWIYKTYGVSASSGWARACERTATIDTPPAAIFEKWALEFLDQWIDSSTAT